MNTINTTRNKRRGFTLTEIAIVLGIVGLILGAIWVAAAAVYNNLRVSHGNTQILQIAQAVRTLYATQSTITAGDDSLAMITAGTVPSDMVNAAATGLTNVWGGNFYVGGTGDGLGIVVQSNAVPQAQCIDLVAMVGGSTRDSGLFQAKSLGAGTTATAYAAIATVPATGALTVAVAPTAASTACVAGLNTLQFGFLLKG